MGKPVTLLLFATFAQLVVATPTITDVTAQQRYPWNGKVDITYTVSGIDNLETLKKEYGLLTLSLKVSAIDCDSGTTNVATALCGDTALTNGTHSIVWDMDADGLTFQSTNVIFSVSCETTPATYCVIDLLEGDSASSYPVSYLAEPPSGGFNVEEYKTTKVVLRRIEPGTFMMCGKYETTLTGPFFMGIFEVTQKQYELVMGINPSIYAGNCRPVEHVGYDTIRGDVEGARWPDSATVDSYSFMGKLQLRTGLNIDLPTEAQWEYACRAGTTNAYNNGGDNESDLRQLGRYNRNRYDSKPYSQHSEVGSYIPNAWELYDMHGNVWEWCLDWSGKLTTPQTDPKGASSGSNRCIRGGSWPDDAYLCTYFRGSYQPSVGSDDSNKGFRLSRILPAQVVSLLPRGESGSTLIDLSQGCRTAASTEFITYSSAWETNAASASASVAVNGEDVCNAFGTGAIEWRPIHNGTYLLSHRVMMNGMQIGETLTATFEVIHFPATPVISPIGGVISAWPLSVTISCATEGATIYYTTDGTEPTPESPIYRRFRISEHTTVKAIAVRDGFCSEVAVAEYAIGQCPNPIITPIDGSTFNWAGKTVSIAKNGNDGVLRYTIDGSDPTATSPVYSAPFTIDDSTVVKAKVFGVELLDSSVVTANLTRVWVNVATPTITAASSFTGSKTKVAITCDTPGATIRYTLNGNDPNSHASRYKGPFFVTDSCMVKAYAVCADYLDSAVATQAITKVWAIGDTVGAPDHTFATDGDLPFVRVTDNTAPLGESMKSGAITHSQTSTLSTTVVGPGTISFQWKTSCEKDPDDFFEWDHAEFEVDGTVVAKLDGQTAWQTVTQAISGDGSHTLLWTYIKDQEESEGEDCCWVADYHWASAYTATQTTPAPVPYIWLRGHFPHTPDEYDAYESAAKEDAANGLNKVWECYVAGLDPTNATDVFRTVISIGADGAPVVGWEPDLNEGGTKHERVYTVEGKENLTDKSWAPTNSASRFFRVKVSMP